MLFFFLASLLTYLSICKATCEKSTESPTIAKPSLHGAARQTFGSGSLRDPNDPTFNKIHIEKQEKLRERDQRERAHFDDDSSSSVGVLVKQPPLTPHVAYRPPGYNTRVGKTPITHHTIVHDEVFRPSGYGTRHDDLWVHQGIMPNKARVFLEPVAPDEEGILSSNPQNSGSAIEVCDATCGSMEFFCSKSCSCIQSDMHCGKI